MNLNFCSLRQLLHVLSGSFTIRSQLTSSLWKPLVHGDSDAIEIVLVMFMKEAVAVMVIVEEVVVVVIVVVS